MVGDFRPVDDALVVGHVDDGFPALCRGGILRRAINAHGIVAACVGGGVKPPAGRRGTDFQVTVVVGTVPQCRVASPSHNSQRVTAADFLACLHQQGRAMAEVQEIDGVGRLVCVQLNTNVVAPLPGLVAAVEHNPRPDDLAGDLLAFVVGHSDGLVVQPYQVDAAVPGLTAAARPAVTAPAVHDLHATVENACQSHALASKAAMRFSNSRILLLTGVR